VTGPLQVVQQSYEDPYSLGQGVYEGARGLMADPVGVVGNSLRSMWNRAKSGPAGLGEVIGENIDPRNFLKPRKAIMSQAVESTARPRIATYFSGGRTVEGALGKNVDSVFAAENSKRINDEANRAFGTSFAERDVNNINVQELIDAKPDLFHASPVCKNFSAAKTMRGATDLDRQSAESVARAIRGATPPIVTIENVADYSKTALFKHITDALDDKGYKWDVVIHDAADYGAPQSRKRMLLRAVREGELPPVPPKTGGKDWFGAVSDLLPDAPGSAIPPVERRRLDEMIARGRLDPSKPIITMGGSGFKGTWAASNAGQVAPTLKAANEKPRIIMPDGTVKAVTNRMMARLMGLGDEVAVPDSPTLAKTVLGNGISGDVTRNLIAPLLNRPKP
jgi:site-specific DNA-cytosine methylase